MLAVLSALFANGIIAILKFAAAIITGSSGMMAEALHSVADTTNRSFCCSGCDFTSDQLLRSILSVMVKSGSSGLS